MGMGWLERKRFKANRRRMARDWVTQERAAHGFAMHMLRQQGQWSDAQYL
jgi:hypothetical protein